MKNMYKRQHHHQRHHRDDDDDDDILVAPRNDSSINNDIIEQRKRRYTNNRHVHNITNCFCRMILLPNRLRLLVVLIICLLLFLWMTTRIFLQTWKDMNQNEISFLSSTSSTTTTTNNNDNNNINSCMPTHHACDGYNGVLHIRSGDYGGAAGTIFFQFIIGQLIYAEKYNLLPYIHLDNYSYLVYDQYIHGGGGIEFTMLHGMVTSNEYDPRSNVITYPGRPIIMNNNNNNLQQPQQSPSKSSTSTSVLLHPKTYTFDGNGIWNNYFYPTSDYCPGDISCAIKPYITMAQKQIDIGLHAYAPWTPKPWRYAQLPASISQPHIPLNKWLLPQRIKANNIVTKYYKFRPWIENQNNKNNNQIIPLSLVPNNNNNKNQKNQEKTTTMFPSWSSLVASNTNQFCLGIHIRWSDKGGKRRKIAVNEFLPYILSYIDQINQLQLTNLTLHSHNHLYNDTATTKLSSLSAQIEKQYQPCIYLATDAKDVINEIQNTWPIHVQNVIYISTSFVRSSDETPVFDLSSHHRTNIEVLYDIIQLSKCSFLLHGNSAVSESAIYLNSNLIYQSINLEEEHDNKESINNINSYIRNHEFIELIRKVVSGEITSDYWGKMNDHNKEWWEEQSSIKSSTTTTTTTTIRSNVESTLSFRNGNDFDRLQIQELLCNGLDQINTDTNKKSKNMNTTTITSTTSSRKILNITLEFSPSYTKHNNPYTMSLNKLATRIFIDLSNLLLYGDQNQLQPIIDDPIWYKWFTLSQRNGNDDSIITNSTSEATSGTTNTNCHQPSMIIPSETIDMKQRKIFPSKRYFEQQQQQKARHRRQQQKKIRRNNNETFQNWHQNIRNQGHLILNNYLYVKPYIIKHAKTIVLKSKDKLGNEISIVHKNRNEKELTERQSKKNSMNDYKKSSPVTAKTLDLNCIGIHIPDPGYDRNEDTTTTLSNKIWIVKNYQKEIYDDYIQAYLKAGGRCIYLSTPSYSIWKDITTKYNHYRNGHQIYRRHSNTTTTPVHSSLDDDDDDDNLVILSQTTAVRNRFITPAHYMESNVHRVGSELLVDIWNMAFSCQFLIHNFSPISDAALLWNKDLQSIHVNDVNRISIQEFVDKLK